MNNIFASVLAAVVVLGSGVTRLCCGDETKSSEQGRVYVDDLTPDKVIGSLGYPVGKGITVECIVEKRETKGVFDENVTVTAVNGKKLAKPVWMPISIMPGVELVRPMKQGDARRFRGYQNVWFTGVTVDYLKEVGEMQGELYHILTAFIVYKDLTPK